MQYKEDPKPLTCDLWPLGTGSDNNGLSLCWTGSTGNSGLLRTWMGLPVDGDFVRLHDFLDGCANVSQSHIDASFLQRMTGMPRPRGSAAKNNLVSWAHSTVA